ncbi:hypothetical protein [Streptomyces cyaneofuscatus]|uniref:hypothetical protein n=1 Tax=Streptomyces cyaneofuscatus TaxID=66883 RepID=UPI0037B8B9D6
MSDPETEDPMVAALLRERAGYASRGMGDRVTQVDEQLALRGHKPAGEADPVSRSTPPKNRRQRPPETA